MNKEKKIVVIGSSNTDLVVRAARMPRPGETLLGGSFKMNDGGKGANQAVAAALLGGNVAFVGKVGADIWGERTARVLRERGIDVSHLGVAPEVASGVALINVDASGENAITVASGANATLCPVDIDAAEPLIAGAAMLVMQLEVPLATVAYAAAMGKRHGATVVLNPAPAPAEPLPDELLHNVDILLPNATEAGMLTGLQVADLASAAKAGKALVAKGVGTVIITLGSKGALLCTEREQLLMPGRVVAAVDTTAAGDTFCGALCVALTEEKHMLTAIRFANIAASISVTHEGAQCSMPQRCEVDRLMAI